MKHFCSSDYCVQWFHISLADCNGWKQVNRKRSTSGSTLQQDSPETEHIHRRKADTSTKNVFSQDTALQSAQANNLHTHENSNRYVSNSVLQWTALVVNCFLISELLEQIPRSSELLFHCIIWMPLISLVDAVLLFPLWYRYVKM